MRVLSILVLVGLGFASMQAKGATDCTIDGTVVNAITGTPIPHARVIPQSRAQPGDGVGTLTGADGKWTMAGAPCGLVQFAVYHPGFLEGTAPGSSRASLEAVLLKPGVPIHDLQIRLVPDSLIQGDIVDEFGNGLANAEVQLLQSGVSEGRRKLFARSSGRTDSRGHYSISGLEAGNYLLCAKTAQPTYPEGGGKPLVYRERCYPETPASSVISTVALQVGVTLKIDLSVIPVSAVLVRGEVSGLPPSVWHPSAGTAGFAALYLWNSATEDRGPAAWATTRDGTVQFSGVMPGVYQLRGAITVNGSAYYASTTITVNDSDVDGVVAEFEPGVSVTGVIRAEGSSDAVGVALAKVPPALVSRRGNAFRPDQFEWTKGGGSFTFSNLERGSYDLNLDLPSPYYVKSIRLNRNEEIKGNQLNVAGTTLSIDVLLSDDPGSVEGLLTDREGNPSNGTIFLFGSERWPKITSTSTAGKFTFHDLAPGEYHAAAFADAIAVEYADQDWIQRNGGQGDTVTITSGQATQVTLIRRTASPQ